MHNEPINKYSNLIGAFEDFAITKSSSLIGGMSISGVDPVGVTDERMEDIARLLKVIVQLLPENASLYQYYCHYQGASVDAVMRGSNKIDTLLKNRVDFLNSKNLSKSFIHHLIELPTTSNLNAIADISFLSSILTCLFDKNSRKHITSALSPTKTVMIRRTEIEETCTRLKNEITQYKDKLGLVSFENEKLNIDELWQFFRFLFNLDPNHLNTQEKAPLDGWDLLLSSGEVESVQIQGTNYLKISGAKVTYARVGSVIGYGGSHTPLAAFSAGDKPAILCDGNYIIQQKFKPYSRLKMASSTSSKKNDIHRQTVNWGSMLTGSSSGETEQDKKAKLSDHHRDMLKELQEIEARSDQRLGSLSSRVVVFGSNPYEINKWVEDINLRLSSNGLHCVWESASLKEAFHSMLPADIVKHPRKHTKNTSHVGALANVYQTSQGQDKWVQTGIDEEVLLTLETLDGKTFGFNPFVGGKCVVLCVGPIRSGKSFTRATLAAHNMKYGGYHLSVDVDSGSESLVRYFSEEANLFKITEELDSGFNLLGAATGIKDKTFIEHFYTQIEMMLQLNSSEELRSLTVDEQEDIDQALKDLLEQPKERRNFSNFVNHLQTNAAKKLKRFVQGEMLGSFFDSKKDLSASKDKRLSAFNLEAIKDNKKILPIVMSELFFRANRLFEDPSIRTVPKILDIDEGHVLLQMPEAGEKIVSAARRIGKYFGGIWLWSQSPEEYRKCDGWDALRTAASALIFMADSEMDKDEYKLTFKLTDGECNRISTLTPKKQFYLVQRDLGISTVVNLNVDVGQFVINASNAMEKEIKEEAFKKYPNDIEKALHEAAKNMGLL